MSAKHKDKRAGVLTHLLLSIPFPHDTSNTHILLAIQGSGIILVIRRKQMYSLLQYKLWSLYRYLTEPPCRIQTASSWSRITNRWLRRAASEDHVMVSDSVKARAGRCRWRCIRLVFDTGIKSSAFTWKCVLSLGKIVNSLLPPFSQGWYGFYKNLKATWHQ